jgi:hypothetical protein
MIAGNGTDRFESLTLISLEKLNSTELGIIPNLILNLAKKALGKTDN